MKPNTRNNYWQGFFSGIKAVLNYKYLPFVVSSALLGIYIVYWLNSAHSGELSSKLSFFRDNKIDMEDLKTAPHEHNIPAAKL